MCYPRAILHPHDYHKLLHECPIRWNILRLGDAFHQSAISASPIELIIDQGVLSYLSTQSFTSDLIFWQALCSEIYHE
jgi:hypothetical protein